ncbi:MAG: bifunctional folylpolyglutamate synthase/dihydrofolate synthase [Bacteroidales bacterium]|nr:bifunctional folylpolyglutamate synthase/dihydrofolate synthase [Bacteroidales bacterium]
MRYGETLDFLFNSLPVYQRIGKAAYKPDLNTTILLDTHLGQPHRKFKAVHIAGTNGKGSVSHMLASVFKEAGYKTGLYTSPHLRDFRERIKINGKLISKEYVVNFVEQNREVINDLKPSFFEMTAAMAFAFFADENVDIAIVETGMGGRLDSTNIITPELSVITNIGLDHVQFLGTTIKQIAIEKGGIIKPEIPVVIGETCQQTKELFMTLAGKKSAEIRFADEIWSVIQVNPDPGQGKMRLNLYKDGEARFCDIVVGLGGNYQLQNILTAIMSIDILRNVFKISDDNIISGLRDVVTNTGLEGRWQVISESPLTICDTAHNCDGLKSTLGQIFMLRKRDVHFVIGIVDDKDIDPVLSLFPETGIYYFTRADIPRALNPSDLKDHAARHNLKGNFFSRVEDAYKSASRAAGKDDLIYIGGSTFVVADFLEIFV